MRRAGEERDRYLDLLRASSILLVVVGHWLELETLHLKPILPWTAWITWGFQVIPVFFLVGGALNLASWRRALERREPWSLWMRRRAQRLLVPLGPLIAFWLALVLALLSLRYPASFVHTAAHAAFVPTWFLGVYLGIVALTPWTARLHARFGWGVPLAFLAGAFLVDALDRRGMPLVWNANGVFVWGAIHQLGYFWREERLPRGPLAGLALALGSLVAVLSLVLLLDYPVSMVAVADERNNVSPPTAALLLFAVAQLGLAIAARPALTRVLSRPRAWAGVRAVGSVTLTIFLWHMTAILLAAAAAWGLGLWPEMPDINASRWIAQPAWVLVALALLAGLVAAFRPFERSPLRSPPRGGPPSAMLTLVGLLATFVGVSWIERRGVYPPATALSAMLAGVATLALGLSLLGALRLVSGARRRPS